MAPIIKNIIYNYKKNDILYKAGDKVSNQSIFFIKEGKAEIKYRLNNEKILKLVIPQYGILGILESVTDENIRIAEVKFLEDSKLYSWDKDEFILNASINPELGMKSIGFLSAYLRTINQKIQEAG